MTLKYGYYAVFRTDERIPPPTGLIARESSLGPVRTVLWDPFAKKWTFEPEVGARYLYDDQLQEFRTPVSRAEAERIASEHLGTQLPSEEELHRVCEEAGAAPVQDE